MLEHGGRLRGAIARYGIPRDQWVDLSSGLSPWPAPLVPVGEDAWARLPETEDGLEQAARAFYGTDALLPVPGSQAAIQALPRLRAHSRVGVLAPCYAEHAKAWRHAGHEVVEVLDGDVEQVLDTLDVLVVVNPNNPTGRLFAPELLLQWHTRLAARGGWLVVDEAFIDITPAYSLAPQASRPGLFVLRSFGKFFGLAGVRLGFVLAAPEALALLAEDIGPWAVCGPTRVIGAACLVDGIWHAEQRVRTEAVSARLAALLIEHGLPPQGGCALFQWCVTEQAHALRDFCAERGILLRLFERYGPFAPSLRFGLPRDEADWQRLAETLTAFNRSAA